MKTIRATIREFATGEELDTELELTERDYHLIGHAPYATEEFEVVAVNGVRLDPETGRYYTERGE
jgi:hypothetical protein